jgi:hypothetical protein
VKDDDVEKAQLFHDIFVELAISHLAEIIEGGTQLVELLLEVMKMPGIKVTSQVELWE